MIALCYPITYAGLAFREFPILPPHMEALRRYEAVKQAGGEVITAWIAFLAAQSGWPTEIVRKINASDFATIIAAYRDLANADCQD